MTEPDEEVVVEATASPGDLGGAGRRVRIKARGEIPFVPQLEAADCGAACLAMSLGYWGCDVRFDDLREAIGVTVAGVTAEQLLEVALRYGLAGRGLRMDLHHLRELPRGSILHWEFAHWVVFDGVTARGIRIVDPARGRREVSTADADRAFTGVALLLEPTERFVPHKRGGSRLWPYLRKLFANTALLGRVLSMTALLQVLAMTVPIVTGIIVDRIVPRQDVPLLSVIGVGAGIAVAFHFLATLVRAHVLVELRTKLDMKMTVGFMRHLVALPFTYFQSRPAGDLMLRVNSNATVREFLTSQVLTALLDTFLLVLYIVVMALMSLPMTAVALALGAARIAVVATMYRAQREAATVQLDARTKSQAYLAQLLAGIETLKAAGAERRGVEQWTNLYSHELNSVARQGRLDALASAMLTAVGTASPLVILSFGAYLVMTGDQSLGTMLALNAFALAFFGPLSTLAEGGLRLSMLGSYLARMDDVLDAELEQERSLAHPAPRLSGHISVRNVSFRYRRDGPFAVNGASLEILPGQTVAIVGPSGCGKSTFARLLLGMHRPTEGQILFDGQDLGATDVVTHRRQIGLVPQQPYLFASTIRDNIALSDPSASLQRIIEAARIAEMHGDIVRLPMQYHTVLADRGETMSGGQRQRLAIARAVLNRPTLLLLDEATSALDAQTELRVSQNLARLRCTKIIIAHRLSTIAGADVIVVMNEGKIVETGSHAQLLARGRAYRALVGAQADLHETSNPSLGAAP